MQPTVAEAQQKTTEYSLSPNPTARHHQAIPEGYNLEEKSLSENRPVPPRSMSEQKMLPSRTRSFLMPSIVLRSLGKGCFS
jgi:hypothetical protein